MPLSPDATLELRNALTRMVRARVPAQDAEDIVQSALIEAIGSPHAPSEPEALRRWLFGVAKNKIVDFHRKQRRETFELPEVEAARATHEEKDLLRWAEGALPEGGEAEQTLEWMLREGEGEKLEAIAASEKLPAPRVRQRVSRLRRHLKANWQREVAVLAALGVIVTMIVLYLRGKKDEDITRDIRPVPSVAPDKVEMAKRTRERALERCQKSDWTGCLRDLDEAKALDPAGDTAPAVQKARDDANRALDPAPTLTPTTPTTPTASPSAILPPEPTDPKGKERAIDDMMRSTKKSSKMMAPMDSNSFGPAKDEPTPSKPAPEAKTVEAPPPQATPQQATPQQQTATPEQTPTPPQSFPQQGGSMSDFPQQKATPPVKPRGKTGK
jgi:RNA polymerase sigma factor (sigma-70 family)